MTSVVCTGESRPRTTAADTDLIYSVHSVKAEKVCARD